MTLSSWHVAVALVGLLSLAAAWGLKARSLRRNARFADECRTLDRWWAAIDDLPAELQTQPLRLTIGRIMYQRLKRARRIHPDHPLLQDQPLRIARFIGRVPRYDGRRVTGAAREQALAALNELKSLLAHSARDRLVSGADIARCEHNIDHSLCTLEFQHYRQAALQAEYLDRLPQAIDCLEAALRSVRHLDGAGADQRDVARRLEALRARVHGSTERQASGLPAHLR